MIKFFKKIILIFFSLIIVAALLFYSLGNTIIDYFIQENLKVFNNDDLDIEVNNPSINFFKFSVDDLIINKRVRFINLPVEFQKLDFEPNLFSILSEEKKFKLYSNFYSGELKVDGGYRIALKKLSSKINLEGVMLESHKLFKQFGIQGGKLNSNCEVFEAVNNQINKVKCNVNLLNLIQPNSLTIPPNLSGLPLPINVPAIKIKEVKFNINLDSSKVALDNFYFASDLANMSGNFELNQGSMNLDIYLLEAGVAEFGALLRAFSNSPSNVNKFSVTTTKHFRDLKIRARM